MTVRSCGTATLWLALLGASGSAAPQGATEEYAARFGRAMVHFDLGSFERAAAGFEAVGALAPGAPVWRIHAARALALAGDAEAARGLVREALALGYPPSDAVAIDPAWAPLVAAAPDVDGPWVRIGPIGSTSKATIPKDEIGPVRVRPEDDALLVLVGDTWHRWDPATCRLEASTGARTVGGRRAALREWSVPALDVPTDAWLRTRALDLVGIRGDLDPDPVLRTPDGRHLLVFQYISPLKRTKPGAKDLLAVVDASGARVVARLGADDGELIGPCTLWPLHFSPSGGTLAVSGEWGALIEVFDTEDWSLRWRVGSRVSRGTSGRCVLRMPNEGRLYASDSTRINDHLCAVYDLRSGAPVYDAGADGFRSIDGTSDDRVVIGLRAESARPLVLLDGGDFSEVVSVGLERARHGGIGSICVGADGTFDRIPRGDPALSVEWSDSHLRCTALAPWLLDPLHLRTALADSDRAPRRIPRSWFTGSRVERPRLDRVARGPAVDALQRPDGALLAFFASGRVESLDPDTGAVRATLHGDDWRTGRPPVASVAVAPDLERVALRDADGRVRVLQLTDDVTANPARNDVADPRPIAAFDVPLSGSGHAPAVRWTASGEHLVTWGVQTVHRDPTTRPRVWTAEGAPVWTGPLACDVAIHPKRERLAFVRANEVHIGWPGDGFQVIDVPGAFGAIEFDPAGKRLAVGGTEARIASGSVHDPPVPSFTGGAQLRILDGATGAILVDANVSDRQGMAGTWLHRLRWSPDGARIAFSNGTGHQPGVASAADGSILARVDLTSGRMAETFAVGWADETLFLPGFHVESMVRIGDPNESIETGPCFRARGLALRGTRDVLLLLDEGLTRFDAAARRVVWQR